MENQPQAITLDIPPDERAGPTELLIRSTVIQPQALGTGADTRNLGVRVYRADILPAEPDETDPEAPECP